MDKTLKRYINVGHRAGVTVFEVFFPATRDDLFSDHDQIPPAQYAGKGETILVIDDEENQRMIACMLLSKLGHEAESVSGGQKAIVASGFSETNRVKEAQKIGAGKYLKKPYTLEELGIAVREELKM